MEEKPLLDENDVTDENSVTEEKKTYSDIARELENDDDALKEDMLSVEKNIKTIRHISMKKTIICAVAIVLAITLTIVAVMLFNKPSDEVDANVKVLYDYNSNTDSLTKVNISTVTIQNNIYNDKIVLTSFMNGSTLEWNIEGQRYDDVNQSRVSNVVLYLSYLETKNIIPYDEDKLDEYGLLSPSAVVEATYSDGSSHTLKIGDVYGSEEGAYILLDEDEYIYIVNVYCHDYMLLPLSDLLNLPTLSKTLSSSQSIWLFDENREVTMLSYIPGPLSGAEAWYLLQPTISETNSDAVDELFTNLESVSLSGVYCSEAGEDLSVYGFDKPVSEIQSYDENQELTEQLVIGKKTDRDDDTYYCAILSNGEEFATSPVYLIKSDQIALTRANPINLANPYLVAVNVYWLRHGEFYIGGERYELTIERTTVYDDDGQPLLDEDGVVSTTNKYFLNGLELNDKQFKVFYSKILFLSIEGLVPDSTEKGDVIFSYSLDVVIPVTDATTGEDYEKEAVYEGTYYEIAGSETYAVFKNNESDTAVFTVKLTSLDNVKKALDLLLAGKLPTN